MKHRLAPMVAGTALCAVLIVGGATAQDLTFGFINPSFGGNPGNSNHLLGLANSQRTATARDANVDSGAPGSVDTPSDDGGDTRADLFVRQLEGRLLSALSAEVTQAIFGDNPQQSGTVEFGDTTITFDRSSEAITLSIIDALNGTATTITVPQLITSTN